MKKVIISDFDGTLTTRDSMMEIIIYQRGRVGLVMALVSILPWVVLMFLHLYSNQKAKERLLHRCFGKMTEQEFCGFCQRFADTHSDIIRKELYDRLKQEEQVGAEVIVITASPEIWVSRLLPDMTVLGTKMEFDDKGFTGRFLTPNCYGQEKVNRLIQHIPALVEHRSDYYITAYGDSRGDKEMMEFADAGEWINEE